MATEGTLEFDGVRYPDGRASDPRRLGWMEGTPPPAEKLVRFADDRFLEFPQIRWSLSHMRELVPTVNVWRGAGPASPFAGGGTPAESAIDELAFTDMNGRERRWAARRMAICPSTPSACPWAAAASARACATWRASAS